MKISVIVTVYNLELYIKECIESIINQTYSDMEIIIINDGSEDLSEEICQEIAKTDNRVKYFYQKNGGSSSARNLGLEKATGDYVMFIDGDDYLYNNNVIEDLVKKLEKCSDNNNILFYRMATYYNKSKKNINDPVLLNKEYDNCSNDILKKMAENGRLSISPCDKLVKLKFIKENKIYFDNKIKICEDMDWSFKLYLKNEKFSLTNQIVYVYRKQRKGSTSKKINEDKIKGMYYVIRKWFKYMYTNEYIKNIYMNYLAYQYTVLIALINKKNCSKSLKKEIYEISDIMNYDMNYKVKKVNKLYNIFGIKITVFILRVYMLVKNLGIYRMGCNGETK